MKTNKKAISFRLSPETIDRIRELSDFMELSQAVVVEQAIKKLYEKELRSDI